MSTATAAASSPSLNAQSVMYMTRAMQRSPVAIGKVIARLSITPVMTINGIPHYAADDAERIFDELCRPVADKGTNFRASIQTKDAVSSPSPQPGRGGNTRRAPGGETGN